MTKLPRKAEYIVGVVAQHQHQQASGRAQPVSKPPPPSPLSMHMPITAALASASSATNAGRMMTGPAPKEAIKRPASYGNAMVDTADDICAGLEFKCLVSRRRFGAGSADACQQVSALLQREVYKDVAYCIHQNTQARAISVHDIRDEKRQESEYWQTHWIVKKANSAEPVETELQCTDMVWIPLELCSPKFLFRGSGVLSIRDVLRQVRTDHTVAVNYTCDVHVHVGRTDGLPFTLLTFKRLATLSWLAEPLLRKVRDPASPNHQNLYTWGSEMRKYSRLALRLAKGEDFRQHLLGRSDDFELYLAAAWRRLGINCGDEYDALKAIWLAPSMLDLGRLLSGRERQYRRLGFNFSALGEEDERARTGPKTIEFRILEGTLDVDLILAWVQLSYILVETATTEQEARFISVVKYLLSIAETLDDCDGDPLDAEFGKLLGLLGLDAVHCRPLLSKVRANYPGSDRQ